MSFLDSVSVPAGAQPTVRTTSSVKPGGSFLSGIRQPTATSSNLAAHNSQVNAAAQVSKANADYANSIPGFAANFGKAAWNASGIPDQFSQGVEQAKENLPTWAGGTAEGHQGPLQAAESALGAGSGVATALFSPLAPVFKPLGAGIQAAGEALSNTPSARAYGAKYANLPANQKTGAERVIGGIANAANIAGAVLGGVEAFTPKVKGGFLESTKLPVESDTAEHSVKISKPNTEPPLPPAYKPVKLPEASHADYAKSQGYEPYTPDDKLPTIKMGPKADNGLPSIQTEAKAGRGVPGDLRYEPIKATPAPKSELAQAHEAYSKAQNYKPETEKSPATPRARTTPVKVAAETAKSNVEATKSNLVPTEESAPAERIPETVRANLLEGGTHPLVNGTNARPYYERMMRGAGMTDAQIKSVLDRTPTNRLGKFNADDVLDSMDSHNIEARANAEPGYKPLTPAESTGKLVKDTLAAKVDAKAVAEGLKAELGDSPMHNQVDLDEQGKFGADFVNNEYERSLQILDGKGLPPDHILISAIVTSLEDLATRTGDGELIKRIENSPVAKQTTRFGQEIGYLSRRSPFSPVKAVREVREAREAHATPAKVRAIVKEIHDSIESPKMADLEDFIKSIECGY